MALENLTPSNRFEAILDGQDIEPSNRKEYFMQKAVSGGGSSLPSYTSADKGKFLGLGEGTPTAQTVIPEQSVTLTTESGSAAYYFTDADNVNIEYFKSVSVGDSCVIVIGGVSENCTASDFMGASLFKTSGNYLIGYDPVQNLCGIVNLNLFEPTTLTISATASVPSVEPKWENVFPPLPTANGNYILTISNGAASWTRQNT